MCVSTFSYATLLDCELHKDGGLCLFWAQLVRLTSGRVPDVLWVHAQSLSCVPLFATPWTVAYQALLSMGYPRQEYWSGLPFPFPGDLPHPGIKPASPEFPALAGGFFATEPPGKHLIHWRCSIQYLLTWSKAVYFNLILPLFCFLAAKVFPFCAYSCPYFCIWHSSSWRQSQFY